MSEVTYKLFLKTSNAFNGSGTNATLSFNLYNQDATKCTGYFVLDHFFLNEFEPGQEDNFEVRRKDVGVPGYLRIKRTGNIDDWFCEFIRVSLKDDESKSATFPIYDWVPVEMGVAEGTATLPQNIQSRNISSMRAAEVNHNQVMFEWALPPLEGDLGWAMPRYVNASNAAEIPQIFKRTTVRQNIFNGNKLGGGLAFASSLVTKTIFDPINELSDYHTLNLHPPTDRNISNFLDNWETDEVMGRQVLTGINPLLIKKCTKLPDSFNVTNGDVSSLLGAGKTLQSEMGAGKIYIANYKEVLEGVPLSSHFVTKKQFYCPASIGLFYSNPEGKFLPIAIQLVPGDRDYLFTPADSKDDWLLAKMYLRCADLSHHEWISHFLLTHNIIEPFSVSLFRSFPRCHPIYKLLKPHLRTVTIINVEARADLVPPGSLASGIIAYNAVETCRAEFKTFTFEDLVIPKKLKKRGTDDSSILPNYFYRDDALMLWKIIEKYVSNVICHYYKNNNDIQQDFELQFWAKDCAKEGLGWYDGNTRGMPENITTIESLIEICTTLIFTSSVQHAAVNFGQLDTYKFAPNCPSGMRLPPHKKGEANLKRILETLSDAFMAGAAITVAKTLSEFSPDEIYLGQFPEKLFIEEAILKLQQDFKDELAKAENIIKERNSKIKVPYTWLLPGRVPSSIAI